MKKEPVLNPLSLMGKKVLVNKILERHQVLAPYETSWQTRKNLIHFKWIPSDITPFEGWLYGARVVYNGYVEPGHSYGGFMGEPEFDPPYFVQQESVHHYLVAKNPRYGLYKVPADGIKVQLTMVDRKGTLVRTWADPQNLIK